MNETKVESPGFEPRTPQSPRTAVWVPTRPLAFLVGGGTEQALHESWIVRAADDDDATVTAVARERSHFAVKLSRECFSYI